MSWGKAGMVGWGGCSLEGTSALWRLLSPRLCVYTCLTCRVGAAAGWRSSSSRQHCRRLTTRHACSPFLINHECNSPSPISLHSLHPVCGGRPHGRSGGCGHQRGRGAAGHCRIRQDGEDRTGGGGEWGSGGQAGRRWQEGTTGVGWSRAGNGDEGLEDKSRQPANQAVVVATRGPTCRYLPMV